MKESVKNLGRSRMTRRPVLRCAICQEPVAYTRVGLRHVSDKAKVHSHTPVLEPSIAATANEVRG